MKRFNCGLSAIAIGILAVAAYSQTAQVTATGYVTDTLAGFHGADEKHVDAAGTQDARSGIGSLARIAGAIHSGTS